MYLSIYVSMYLCIYVSMYLCICVSMYLCICVSMYLCIYVSMYLCICVSMYLCIYVSKYLCIDSSFLSIIFILKTSYGKLLFKVVELDKLQLIPFVFYVRSYRRPYFRKPVQLVMTGLKNAHYYDSCVCSINTEPVHCLRL
jgi:hypothetical protein